MRIRDLCAEMADEGTIWYRNRPAWAFIARGYLPWLAILNLTWETVHLPLYDVWKIGDASYLVFVVAHCTLGDILIGFFAISLALIALRARTMEFWRWSALAVLTVLLGVGYTAFSEWLNTRVLQSWAYSDLMPTITVSGVAIGVSPLMQWVVLPPLATLLGRSLPFR